MTWFKNLNAMPRLMGSFGLVLALTLGISYLSITNLRVSSERIDKLYLKDMKGLIVVDDIALARMELGRQGRDAILKMKDPEAVAADEKLMLADFTKMHSALEGADSSFYLPEGKAAIAVIRDLLPAYEKKYHDLYDRVRAKDLAGAKAELENISITGKPLSEADEKARKIKSGAVERTYLENGQTYQAARALTLTAAAASLALGLVLSIVISRGFSLPLSQTVIALERMAEGDLTIALKADTTDEVGRLSAALNHSVKRLNQTLQQVADSASNASASSQQLAAAAEAIASGAHEQASSLQETSASLEEITATVRQSADNAKQANQLATGSRDAAESGQSVVSNAVSAMGEINQASAKISNIISTIDEIAFQTNLLAVNAAVEAARAGDEGRGFAVVASEVRSLAQRSATAAKEIKKLIQDSLAKVERGMTLVNRSGETLQGIVGSVKRVTDIVADISVASQEQSSGIEQVNSAMTQMDQVMQSNSAHTEELSATAQALSEQAAKLLAMVNGFKLSEAANTPGVLDRTKVTTLAKTAAAKKSQVRVKLPAHGLGMDEVKPALLVPVGAGSGEDAFFEEF